MFEQFFGRPDLLLPAALPVLAVATLLWWLGYRARQKSRDKWGERDIVDTYSRKVTVLSEMLQFAGWFLGVAALALAACEPVMPDQHRTVPAGRVNVVAVYDVSRSMAAEDYRHTLPAPDGTAGEAIIGPHGNRLAMCVYATKKQLMPSLGSNKIGLVTFTMDGWPMWALTDDHETVSWILDNWVDIGKAPGGGSDFVQGLKEAIATFRMNEQRPPAEAAVERGKEKVIVLFSDGAWTNDMEELLKVIEEIKALKIRLVVIGVGNKTPQRIPVYDKVGNQTGWYQVKGKDAYTGLDEESLQTLARLTGGEYVHLDPDTKLPLDWAGKVGGGHVETGKVPIDWMLGLAGICILVVLSLRGLLRSRTE